MPTNTVCRRGGSGGHGKAQGQSSVPRSAARAPPAAAYRERPVADGLDVEQGGGRAAELHDGGLGGAAVEAEQAQGHADEVALGDGHGAGRWGALGGLGAPPRRGLVVQHKTKRAKAADGGSSRVGARDAGGTQPQRAGHRQYAGGTCVGSAAMRTPALRLQSERIFSCWGNRPTLRLNPSARRAWSACDAPRVISRRQRPPSRTVPSGSPLTCAAGRRWRWRGVVRARALWRCWADPPPSRHRDLFGVNLGWKWGGNGAETGRKRGGRADGALTATCDPLLFLVTANGSRGGDGRTH